MKSITISIEAMPDDFIIKPFIIANRAEVKNMLFEEYDEEKYKNLFIEEGREEGRVEGIAENRISTARNLLASGVSDDIIINSTGISAVEFEKIKAETEKN